MKKPVKPPKPVYTVEITPSARKQLLTLPKEVTDQLRATIDSLALEPRPMGVKKLKGRDGYRVRTGNYRIMYSIFDKVLVIEVVKVGTRGNFYDE